MVINGSEDAETLALLADLIGEVIWDQNLVTGETWCSEALREQYGHDPASAARMGDNWIELVHPADRRAVTDALARAEANKAARLTNRYRFRRADGTYAMVEDRVRIRRNAKGDAVRMTGVLVDITETEAATERQRLLASVSSDATLENVRDRNVVIFGEGMRRVFGIDLEGEHPIPSGYVEHIHPDDRDAAYHGFYDMVNNGGPRGQLEYRLRRGDGTYAHVQERFAVQRDDTGKPLRVHSSVIDVSELRASEQRKDLLVRATTQVVIDYDVLRDELRWSGATAEKFGYKTHEMPTDGEGYLALLHPEDRAVLARALSALRRGEVWEKPLELNYRVRRADGSYARILDRSISRTDENGRGVGVVVVLLDVSDLMRDQERLRAIMEISSDATYEYYPLENRIVFGEGFKTRFGHDWVGEQPIPSPWQTTVHPDERASLSRAFLAFVGDPDQTRWTCAYRMRRGDGTWAHVEERVAALRDEDGNAVLVIGSVDDTTERRRVEDRLHAAVEALENGFTLYDDRQRLVLHNRRFAEINADLADLIRPGVTRQELLEALIQRRGFHDPEKAHAALSTDEGGQIRAQIAQSDGRILAIDNHRTIGGDWVSLITDVTELLRNQERLRTVMEIAADAIYELDVVRGIYRFGGGIRAAFGHDWAGERPAKTVPMQAEIHPEDAPARAQSFGAFLDSEEQRWSSDYRMRRGDGTWAHVEERSVALRDERGKPFLVIGSLSDVTERRRLEDQLHAAQKMEAIGRIAGGIAHDFNNLLAVILGNAELLMDDEGDPVRLDFATEIVDATRRGAELTQRLLSFARRARLSPQVIDLNECVSGMGKMLARVLPATIRLEPVLMAGLWKTAADPAFVESALLNLVVNARDAMPKGGTLTIETGNQRVSESYGIERGEDVTPGRYVMLAVTDTGSGIARDILDRVVEPFFTTKGPNMGTGLGLSMVHGFVRQSGGALRIYSEPGIGTTVKLMLPAVGDTPDRPVTAGPARSAQAIPGRLRLLLVEDEPEVRRVIARMLTERGLEVTEAVNGDAALTLFEAADRPFDILLTDVVMPGRLQGPALARELKARDAALSIVFISGYANEAAVNGNGLRPDDAFLMKPVQRADLLALIGRLVDQRHAGGP